MGGKGRETGEAPPKAHRPGGRAPKRMPAGEREGKGQIQFSPAGAGAAARAGRRAPNRKIR